MGEMNHHWFREVTQWTEGMWNQWRRIAESSGSASFHLDDRTVRSLFAVAAREVSVVVWHDGSWEDPANWRGVAVVEDTFAESHGIQGHLSSRSGTFSLMARWMHRRRSGFRFSVRVVGSVLGSGAHAYRFLPEIPVNERRAHVGTAIEASLTSHPGRLRPKVALVKDFPKIPRGGNSPEQIAGGSSWLPSWLDLEFDPVMVLPLNPEWSDLEGYFNELRTKSRTKVKRILACSASCTLNELSLAEVEELAAELHDLYYQVYSEASFRLGTLHPEDLVAAKREWGDSFKVQVIRHNERIVAFQCGYLTRDSMEAFFVGFHRGLNRDLSLYQRMLLEFIRWGIEAKVGQVNMGRTALDIKSSVGGMAEEWFCSVHFKSTPIQHAAKFVARRSWPKYQSLKRPWKEGAYPVAHVQPRSMDWF